MPTRRQLGDASTRSRGAVDRGRDAVRMGLSMDPATRLSPRERQILVNALVDLRDSTAVELPRVAAWV